jgi:hypothetical protein
VNGPICDLAGSQVTPIDEIFLASKVVVERALGDAHGCGDAVKRGVGQAVGVEDVGRYVKRPLYPVVS